MSDPQKERIARALGAWYRDNRRDLPWRRTKDPYRIWVSEIMAQQTRISALLPYYERFIQRFPDVHVLARADEEDVLSYWAGLGYYSRARNLHRAAKQVSQEMQGRIPDDAAQIEKLPGIGEYTAGAIASIAFGRRTPAVDGNVKRVYARLYRDRRPLQDRSLKQDVRDWVETLMPHEEPSVITQSLMELGALVCTPRKPACVQCPVRLWCAAHRDGLQETLPTRSTPPKRRVQRLSVLVIEDDRGYRMMRRRTETLLSGLYDYPSLSGFVPRARIEAELSSWGYEIEGIQLAGSKDHVFTHILWHMRFYRCRSRVPLQDMTHDGYQAFSPSERDELAIPRAFDLPRQR